MRSIVIPIVFLMNSCIPVNYDSQMFVDTSNIVHKVERVEVSYTIYPFKGSIFNNDKGPWVIVISAKSPVNSSMYLRSVSIHSNEKTEKIFSGAEFIPLEKTDDYPFWCGEIGRGDLTLKLNPLFYPTQKITVEIEVSVDGKAPVFLRENFKPRHLQGNEVVNMLTM